MKRSKKCFGLFVALFIMLGLSLSVCLDDTNALRHDYAGITYYQTAIPNTVYNSTTGEYEVGTYDNDGVGGYLGSYFQLQWEGDAYQSEYDNLSMKKDTATLDLGWDSNKNKCSYGNGRGIYNTLPWSIPYNGSSLNGIDSRYGGIPRYIDDWLINKNSLMGCQTINKFGENGKPDFDEQSTPTGPLAVLSCDKSNGLTCGHIEFVGNIVHNDILPYYYSADGFYIHNSAVSDSTGNTYYNTFSFYDMFNGGKASKAYIPTFSKLVIPFSADYFLNSENLYSGRDIEFRGLFAFNGSFDWHQDFQTNGSYWRINGMGLNKDTGQWDYFNFNCNLELTLVENQHLVSYSCPYTLEHDYLVADFSMELSGNGNYLFQTDDEWFFAHSYYITDNDETVGSTFNEHLTGNSKNIIGSAEDNIPSDGGLEQFFNNLTNLFSFNFTNPFAPLFNLFTSGENCASIPIIAGMLHTEETTYCSWFPASVKNVLTPVFGLSSVMLVFGFAVHWLGSSSGNMFEDSGTHEWGKLRFGNGGKK